MQLTKSAPAGTGATQRAASPDKQRRHYTALAEIPSIARDILRGALPICEVPVFLFWLLRGEA